MPVPLLQDVELDALTEVCNIGMGHAATALSQLMGKPVCIEAPRLRVLEPAGLDEFRDAQEVAGLYLQILGNVRGSILILLGQENARRVLELLLGELPAPDAPLSELGRSTLMEVGNILASACLNALGAQLQQTLLPSVPHLEFGAASTLLAHALGHAAEGETALMIDTRFSIADAPCCGSIVLIPAAASLRVMLGSLGDR
jgi:chemotaxis protein CheC